MSTVAIAADRRLRVTFVDGIEGEVDMRAFLADPKVDGTIFEPLVGSNRGWQFGFRRQG